MNEETSTLAMSERRYAAVTLAMLVVCAAAGIVLLVLSLRACALILWAICALLWCVPTTLNVIYVLRHPTPTVGMMPVSLVSLGPPSLAALCNMRTFEPLVILLIALLALCVGIAILFATWFWRLWRTYAHAATPAQDAVIIVCGCALEGTRPAPTLRRRLDVAVSLSQTLDHASFILSGGPVPSGVTTEADAMATYLTEQGVDRSRLLLERRARNTRDNVRLSLEIAKKSGLDAQPCILSSDYHLYRALHEGRQAGVDLTPIPASSKGPSWLQQWCREVLTILVQRSSENRGQ